MKTLFNGILFDLDGTLIDSTADIAGAVNHARKEMNMTPLPLETVRTCIGDGVHILMERALETRDSAVIDRAIALWRPHYLAHCLEHTRLYPGVMNMLNALASGGMNLGVVSNKPAAPSETILNGLGVRKLFAAVVGGDSTPKRKPDPEPLRFALEQMKITSKRVLVVGDSLNDIEAARRAGLISCGVLWGIGYEETVRAARPDHLAQTPADVLEIVHP